MDLNERKMRILKSIIDEYIAGGEPVGSKHLVEHGNISLSPATIRNEMSELEEMGYLDKPHTSAGRIPSNAAYRIYVEKLMESYRLNVEELTLLGELARYKLEQIDKLVSKVTTVISEITNCAALALMTSGSDKHVVSRFDAHLIDENSFLLIMVLPDGSVKTNHIKTDTTVTSDAVGKIKSALNRRLCNVSLEDVALPIILQLEQDFGMYSHLASVVVRGAYESVCSQGEGNISVDGISNLLSYPEFMNIDKVKRILSLVENNNGKIKDVLSRTPETETGLQVFIGEENQVEELSDTSVVYCSIPIGNGQSAVLGIVGPKRMDYGKVISALHKLADTLEVKQLPGGQE